MKKRVFLALFIALLAVGAAFAQPELKLSAGAGGFFGSDFGGGAQMTGKALGGFVSADVKIELPYSGFGGYAFFDATYAELSVGYFSSKLKPKIKASAKMFGTEIPIDPETYASIPTVKIQSLNIGLLGKYPVAIMDNLTLFPLLGIEYQAALSVKDVDSGEEYRNKDDKKAPGDWSSLWFKAGVGMDLSFTDQLYLRLGVLYGLRLPNKAEKEMVDQMKTIAGGEDATMTMDAKTLLGHGLTAKLAIGFRF